MPRAKLDAFPDRIDARDWFYRPSLIPVADFLDNRKGQVILDQGTEGACTGYALAATINFLLGRHGTRRLVSPWMLYEMARRYDEWPGEGYEGSSARGAMKGWVSHGVCREGSWPRDSEGKHEEGPGNLAPAMVDEARETPGGAYYRVLHREVRDMHTALAEVGILYVTLMVHAGWDDLADGYSYSVGGASVDLPVIKRKGFAKDGHAVAIVGYTPHGFIIQNSWGDSWGAKGFAMLPYEDYMLNATDVWVAQLGAPVKMDLWKLGYTDDTAGMQRASHAIPLADIRPYVVDVGNNGELSSSGQYWTTPEDVQRLFSELIPAATKTWKKKRVLFYLHGGLNDEASVAKRIVAFREVMLKNEIYPVHLMWETSLGESLTGMLEDLFTDVDERAGGVRDWWDKLRAGLTEAKDRSLEITLAGAGRAVWSEIKENGRLASSHPDGRGGVQLIAKAARDALEGADPKEWELHVVGHSAGSIVAAYALPLLADTGVALGTVQFMAPAITVEDFEALWLDGDSRGRLPHPTLYLLGDSAERDDTVGPYGKSLLYLVSNACESLRETPLLGMQMFVDADPRLKAFFQQPVDGRPSLVVAKETTGTGSTSASDTHGGFDNDVETMNSVVCRILGMMPPEEKRFKPRDLKF